MMNGQVIRFSRVAKILYMGEISMRHRMLVCTNHLNHTYVGIYWEVGITWYLGGYQVLGTWPKGVAENSSIARRMLHNIVIRCRKVLGCACLIAADGSYKPVVDASAASATLLVVASPPVTF